MGVIQSAAVFGLAWPRRREFCETCQVVWSPEAETMTPLAAMLPPVIVRAAIFPVGSRAWGGASAARSAPARLPRSMRPMASVPVFSTPASPGRRWPGVTHPDVRPAFPTLLGFVERIHPRVANAAALQDLPAGYPHRPSLACDVASIGIMVLSPTWGPAQHANGATRRIASSCRTSSSARHGCRRARARRSAALSPLRLSAQSAHPSAIAGGWTSQRVPTASFHSAHLAGKQACRLEPAGPCPIVAAVACSLVDR